MRNDEWAARPAKPPRSVFGNYRPKGDEVPSHDVASQPPGEQHRLRGSVATSGGLQEAIDISMARSFLYRFLAQAYEDPTEEGWTRMATSDCDNSRRML